MLLAVFSDSHGAAGPMAAAVEAYKPDRVLFLGDGVPVHREKIREILGDDAVFAPVHQCFLRPSAAGALALEKAERTDYLGLQATYLRPPNAQKNKKLMEAMSRG